MKNKQTFTIDEHRAFKPIVFGAILLFISHLAYAENGSKESMALDFFNNRTLFETQISNPKTESFDHYASSATTTCDSPVGHEYDNCFPMGNLEEGFTLSTNLGANNSFVAVPPGIFNAPSACLSMNQRSHIMNITCPAPHVEAFGFDVYDYLNQSLGGAKSSYTLSVYDPLGNFLGTTTFQLNDPEAFIGVISNSGPIGNIQLEGNNAFETIDNLLFSVYQANDEITLNCPANQTVSCASDIVPTELIDVDASTTCSDDILLVTVDGPLISGGENCDGTTYTYIYQAQDNCGNTLSCQQVFTIANAAPTISCPGPSTITCSDEMDLGTSAISYTTSCGLNAMVQRYGALSNGPEDCPGTIHTLLYRVTDECGRSTTCERVYIIEDAPPPITCVFTEEARCADDIVPDPSLLTYVPPCGLSSMTSIEGPIVNGTEDCPGTTYTYTIIQIDECGTSNSCQQIFTLTGEGSSSSCPGDITISCDEDSSPANTGMASGTSSCGVDLVITFDDVVIPGSCPQEKIIERTWTITDICGASTGCTAQQITVIDNEAPLAPNPPVDRTVECLQDVPANQALTAMDNCAGAITVMPSEQIVEQECSSRFTLIRTWTFDDGCNQSSISQSIQVVDTQPISILSTGTDKVVDCVHNAIPEPYLVEVATPCGSNTEVEVQGPIVHGTPNCPGTQYIYTYTASDDCGRTATAEQVYTIENDPPEFVCPPDICILDCDFSMEAIQQGFDDFASVAKVNTSCIGPAPIITNDFDPNGFIAQKCAEGPIAIDNTVAYQIVTFTATDQCNRSTTCTALVVMVDQTAPEIVGTVNNQIVECDENILLYYDKWIEASMNQLSASDACGTLNWSYEPLVPNMTCNGVIAHTLVQFIATDECGNSSWVTGKFGIKNQHPPTFTSTLEDQSIPCGTLPEFDTPTYGNACGETELTYEDEMIPGACGGVSAIVRVWTVVDLCNGKTATMSQRIDFTGSATIQFVQVPEDKEMTCEEWTDFDEPVCLHSCQGFELIVEDQEEVSCGGSSSMTRIWTAIDDCGSSISCQQTIKYIDETPPVFVTFPEDVTDVCQEQFDYGTPEADDNCGTVHLTYLDNVEGNCEEGMTIHRLWSAVDACGNATSQTQVIELLPHSKKQSMEAHQHLIFDDQLHLAPNPVSSTLNLRFRLEEAGAVEMVIYNLQGKVMATISGHRAEGQQHEIVDLSVYPEGNYIVMVQHHGLWLSRQFVKINP